jgi:hypothetical protein
MYDPLSQPGILLAYLSAVLALGVGATLWSHLAWRSELAAVRSSLLLALGLPEGAPATEASAWARIRVESLAPCREQRGRRRITRLRRGAKCWLCMTPDRILLVRDGNARVIPLGQVRRIALSDAPARGHCRLVIETGPDPVTLDVSRVADMVRVVNLAVKHHIAVGYVRT